MTTPGHPSTTLTPCELDLVEAERQFTLIAAQALVGIDGDEAQARASLRAILDRARSQMRPE